MSSTRPPRDSDFRLPDPDALLANVARAFGVAADIARLMAEKPVAPPVPGVREVVFEQLVQALGEVAKAHVARPDGLFGANRELLDGHVRLLRSALGRRRGEVVEPIISPERNDRRFKDPGWQQNQLLDVLKQSYLLTSRWAKDVVAKADGVDGHTRHKARFYVEQIANALAPTNFPLANPQVLRLTLASSAENLVAGLRNLAEDIASSDGELELRLTDASAFEVGRNLATTPGKVVYQNELMQLIQYAPSTEKVCERPLLIVPPWINKFYILDLNPQKSFVAWAVAHGMTVFVISWVNPDERFAMKSFADYMRQGVLAALEAVEQATGVRTVNALGYCIGGTLLAATLGYMAAGRDHRVQSASLVAAQIDFEDAGDLLVFIDEAQVRGVERHMAAKGYLEGRKMARTFSFLRANELIWATVIETYFMGKSPVPFDILYWNSDATRMPAAMLSFYLRECYLQNALAAGRMVLDGVPVDLARVKVPVYNLAPREDHISPLASVFKLGRHLGGTTRLVVAGSGHVAGIVNPPAARKYSYWTGDSEAATPDEWLAAATEHAGSWWPDWQRWIAGHAGPLVEARWPGSGKLKVIEDAPGSYVKVRAE
ncbi:MAG TPA: class I poly(R)-hydroxyalkanoic acid synthase [Aestuariivirgaceae bacterium]|nr:class I poly(R)-hydroxyalkanoic acid synthase [Aestuariivirgaceae bacterium]